MGSDSDALEPLSTAGRSAYERAVDVVLTGVAVILPAVITIYVLDAALGILVSILDPVVRALVLVGVIPQIQESGVVVVLQALGLYDSVSSFLSQLIALVLLGLLIVVLGVMGRNHYGDRLIDYFDQVFMAVPGVGTVYKSFRRMSDAMLESEMENFRSVNLVEFPRDGTYVLGFETARPPAAVRRAIDPEEPRSASDSADRQRHRDVSDAGESAVKTMFLPLAPNPVMGGFLAHVPEERIIDVDLTVEEGVRNIITSGIGTQSLDDGLSEGQLHEMGVDVGDLPLADDSADGSPTATEGTSTRTDASSTDDRSADADAVEEPTDDRQRRSEE